MADHAAMGTKLTGIFIGAGASYELGMPLVWELTTELKKWLTPEKLWSLNESWRSQGGGYSDEVVAHLVSLLQHPKLHYESILGNLEMQFRRRSSARQEYHGLYSWLVEMVYYMLYDRHVKNVGYIQQNLRYFDGLSTLASQNTPLWIFSLNHDLMIECLAMALGVPVNSGFTEEVVTLPRRGKSGEVLGRLRAAVLSGEQLERSGIPFFQHGTHGINLMKIHGALDIFTFRNGQDLLKILPLEDSVEGVLESLRAVNEELIYRDLRVPADRPLKVTNEIVYADDAGEMQFLRRSLLAGAFKFDKRHSQNQALPPRLLLHFKSNLNYVTSLVCIGYGFGDEHINQVIRGWLEFTSRRRLEIVGPDPQIPPVFLHLAPQITLRGSTTTDYLDSIAGIKRDKRDRVEKRFAGWMRGCPDPAAAIADLQSYLRDQQSRALKSLPGRDGDVALDKLGITLEEFIRQGKERIE